MPAYVLVQANIEDNDTFRHYEDFVPSTLQPYHGRYLVRGGRIDTAVGNPLGYTRVVVIEFPTLDLARAWFRSPEYAKAREIKGASMDGSVVIIEGTTPSSKMTGADF